MPLVGGFGCLELCLCVGNIMIPTNRSTVSRCIRPMRVLHSGLVISSRRDEGGPADTLPHYLPRLQPQPGGVGHQVGPQAHDFPSQLVVLPHLLWTAGTQGAVALKSKTLIKMIFSQNCRIRSFFLIIILL